MHPILGEVFGYPIYSYGLLIACGVLCNYFYLLRHKQAIGLNATDLSTLIVNSILLAILGGKVFQLFADPTLLMSAPAQFLFDSQGYVFYGGMLFCVSYWIIYTRRNQINTFVFLDFATLGGLMVLTFGKLGCFLSGCCFGKETQGPFGVVFSDIHSAAIPLNTPLYPVQLVDALVALVILLPMLRLKKVAHFNGQIIVSAVMLYAIGRFTTEFLRGDPGRTGFLNSSLSMSQEISILLFLTAVYLYRKLKMDRAQQFE